MKKTVNPCKVRIGRTLTPVFCRVELEDGKLSISGVVGPLPSGNCRGGCGQIDMEFYHRDESQNDSRYNRDLFKIGPHMVLSEDWTADQWYKFLEVWHDYHLNDMSPCCEHQRAAGWDKLSRKKVFLYHWDLKMEWYEKKRALEKEAIERAKSVDEGRSLGFYAQEKKILNLESDITTTEPELSGELAKYYEPSRASYRPHKEEKTLGWLDQSEHPEGLLSRVCDVCGYKYGSAWQKIELPQEVIKFLEELPESKVKPAWV